MKKILLVLILLLVGGGFFLFQQREAAYQEALEVTMDASALHTIYSLEIPSGASPIWIGNDLASAQIIISDDAFVRYVKESGDATKLQAGTFYVTPSMTIPEVVDVLTGRATPMEETITIREGLRLVDMDAYLTERGLIEAGELMECAQTCTFTGNLLPDGYIEGYVFPDTYNIVPQQFSVEDFLQRMITTFHSRITDEMIADIESSGRSFEDVIIMASIIEKESRPADDRSIVSGILWNRIDVGMLMGADATLLYEREDPKAPITYAELQEDNPYNTRKNPGLPPTPIANPGLDSIKAAIYPSQTDYWYYLHAPNGQIHFAKTNAEHNSNKAKYLR